jgi:uncharacterized membrane protein (UPF0127 family)
LFFFDQKSKNMPISERRVARYGSLMNRAVLLYLLLVAGSALSQETAQVTLPLVSLSVAGKAVTAEVADDAQERSMGLMFRERLAPNGGMLFVMPKPERASFWMKNTTLPLSVAYINSAGVILEIHDLQPLDEKPVPSAFPNIAYALEMEQGWFNENGILAGDRIQGLPPSRGQ